MDTGEQIQAVHRHLEFPAISDAVPQHTKATTTCFWTIMVQTIPVVNTMASPTLQLWVGRDGTRVLGAPWP